MAALPFSLLLITDDGSARSAERAVVETVTAALGGSDASRVAVLLRDKRGALRDVERTARALLPIVREAGARLLVHTHVELVTSLGLDGAHLDSRADLQAARDRLGPDALVGASRHAGDPLDEGALAPLDYVTFSPVFSPASKPSDTRPSLGLDGLARGCQESARPVVALGGVTPDNARACLAVGAAAVAVLGGVMAAPDPARALRRYLEACALSASSA